MAIAVLTLRFDEQAAGAVRQLWELLVREGIEEAGPPRHRPHVTVAAYEVDEVVPLCEALPELTRQLTSFLIRFHSLGVFPESGTVFLAPLMTGALLTTHRALLRSLSEPCGAPLHPGHSLPDSWTPHCTLATGLAAEDVPRVVRFCQENWRAIEGTVEVIGILVLPEKQDCCETILERRA